MKSTNTKIGDIFSVKVSESAIKYFQLVAFDLTQLNSDVIRVFKKSYEVGSKPKLENIVCDDVEFYAHCISKLGIKMNQWERVGNIEKIGNVETILFRGSEDYGVWIGDKPIRVSEKWYIWRINQGFQDVGKLEGENRKAEIGVVINPMEITNRIKTGEYTFFYPGFE